MRNGLCSIGWSLLALVAVALPAEAIEIDCFGITVFDLDPVDGTTTYFEGGCPAAAFDTGTGTFSATLGPDSVVIREEGSLPLDVNLLSEVFLVARTTGPEEILFEWTAGDVAFTQETTSGIGPCGAAEGGPVTQGPFRANGVGTLISPESGGSCLFRFSTSQRAGFGTASVTWTVVPEPAIVSLLGAGLAGLGVVGRRTSHLPGSRAGLRRISVMTHDSVAAPDPEGA